MLPRGLYKAFSRACVWQSLDPSGTLAKDYSFKDYPIAVAGKTGTAEYCDDVA